MRVQALFNSLELLQPRIHGRNRLRSGHGFAAACAKLGAAVGVFFFPILLASVGTSALLYGIAGTTMLALVITRVFRIETTGKSFDEISGRKLQELSPRPSPP